MVDFNKIREENAKKAMLATTANSIPATPAKEPVSKKEPKPRAIGRDREEDISMLEILSKRFRSSLNDWEKQFVDSNYTRLRKYDNATLSIKQAEFLDKIWDEKAVDEIADEDDFLEDGDLSTGIPF